MPYKANTKRYQKLIYRRCGKSGLLLPPITLGLWHNFGCKKSMPNESKKMIFRAFNRGVTHFDLSNNYGNLIQRIASFIVKNSNSKVTKPENFDISRVFAHCNFFPISSFVLFPTIS